MMDTWGIFVGNNSGVYLGKVGVVSPPNVCQIFDARSIICHCLQ